ncbi:hypothetical protein ALON55S_02001 [Alishewanella longhuensis]
MECASIFGSTTVSTLDQATVFNSREHLKADNAAALIYSCGLADFAAIDRDQVLTSSLLLVTRWAGIRHLVVPEFGRVTARCSWLAVWRS